MSETTEKKQERVWCHVCVSVGVDGESSQVDLKQVVGFQGTIETAMRLVPDFWMKALEGFKEMAKEEGESSAAAGDIEAVLQAARHELTTLHGCFVTDRPEMFADSELRFKVDVSEAIAKIDCGLNSLGDNENRLS